MGLLDKILRRRKPAEDADITLKPDSAEVKVFDDFIEEAEIEEEKGEAVGIGLEAERYLKVLHIYGLSDVDLLQSELMEKNIVIVDISPLKKTGSSVLIELKRAVEQLRGITRTLNGDIAQLSDKYLILTPRGIKIWRRPLE